MSESSNEPGRDQSSGATPDRPERPDDMPDDAVEATFDSATEDLVSPPSEPDPDGPDASTVDSGGGPQQGASDDRDR